MKPFTVIAREGGFTCNTNNTLLSTRKSKHWVYKDIPMSGSWYRLLIPHSTAILHTSKDAYTITLRQVRIYPSASFPRTEILATQFNSFKPDVLPNALLFITMPATKGGNLIQLRIDAWCPGLDYEWKELSVTNVITTSLRDYTELKPCYLYVAVIIIKKCNYYHSTCEITLM